MKFINFVLHLWTLVFALLALLRISNIEDGSFIRQQSIREEWANKNNHDLTQSEIYKLQEQVQGLRLEIRQLSTQTR